MGGGPRGVKRDAFEPLRGLLAAIVTSRNVGDCRPPVEGIQIGGIFKDEKLHGPVVKCFFPVKPGTEWMKRLRSTNGVNGT